MGGENKHTNTYIITKEWFFFYNIEIIPINLLL